MKLTQKFIMAICCFFIATSIYASDNAEKVTYKWKDDNGIIQYTERPPKSKAYEKITVKTGGAREVTQVSEEEAVMTAKEESQSDLDELNKANERNCKVAQQNLQVLQQMARIRVTENGEERILSPEEKQSRISETQKQIDIYCKPL